MDLIFRRLWINNILNKDIGKFGFVCFINVLFEYQETWELSKIVKEDSFSLIYLECLPEDVKEKTRARFEPATVDSEGIRKRDVMLYELNIAVVYLNVFFKNLNCS